MLIQQQLKHDNVVSSLFQMQNKDNGSPVQCSQLILTVDKSSAWAGFIFWVQQMCVYHVYTQKYNILIVKLIDCSGT